MPDKFTHGLMLGEVLQLSKHTAAKVDVIEARQVGLIQRIDRLESSQSPKNSSPDRAVGKIAMAVLATLTGLVANIKAESVGEMIGGLIRGLSP